MEIILIHLMGLKEIGIKSEVDFTLWIINSMILLISLNSLMIHTFKDLSQ